MINIIPPGHFYAAGDLWPEQRVLVQFHDGPQFLRGYYTGPARAARYLKIATMTHKEIVDKLIGPIQPYGSSDVDESRYSNLIDMVELVDALLLDIKNVAAYRDRQEHSMKQMGQYAHDFLTEIKQ